MSDDQRTASAVTVAQDGYVRTIILNTLEKKNAINDELGWAITAALEEAAVDECV